MISEHFHGVRAIRLLYIVLTAVGLGLAITLLWFFWNNGGTISNTDIPRIGSPILVVPNDVTMLAIIAPLSLALLYREPCGVVGLVSACSLLLSVFPIVVMQRRTAAITMMVTLGCMVFFLWPRHRFKRGLACALAVIAFVLVVDWALGSPLSGKFLHRSWDAGRLPLWVAAWGMFRDAPLLGYGPHSFVLLYQSYLHEAGYVGPFEQVSPWAHNLYLEALAEQGIVGLLSLGLLLGGGLYIAWKAQRTANGDVRIFTIGALAGLVGLCSAGMVELSLIRQWVVIMLFTLVGVIVQLYSCHMRLGGSTHDGSSFSHC